MNALDTLNTWGAGWSAAMTRSLVDASVLLAVVVVIWLPLRKRISVQLAHGLFCLVLLRLAVPHPLPWPGWMPAISLNSAVIALQDWSRPGPSVVASTMATTERSESFALPTTGDISPSASDSPVTQVTGIDVPSQEVPGERLIHASGPRRLSLAAGLMIAWALLASGLLLRFFRAVLATRALVRDALPVDPRFLPVDIEVLCGAAGVSNRVRWAVSPRLRSPAVAGLWRPTVVLPPDLEEGLTGKQLTWVLLHELAHVRRGDLWIVTAQRVVQAIYFFHPAVHVTNWVIDQLREYACDDAALAACKTSRRDCGEGFLTVVGRTVERPPMAAAALGLFESRMLIRRRLVRILDPRRKVQGRLSTRAVVGLLFAAPAALAFGRTRDLSDSARTPKPLDLSVLTTVEPEPLTYRPGESWHNESERGAGPAARVPVLGVTYSPDGSRLAICGEDGLITVRDVRTGQVMHRLSGHQDAVTCVVYSPDGSLLASAGYDRSVRLWDSQNGNLIARLEGHANWVFALAFSPDGRKLASAGHDRNIVIWDVASRIQSGTLRGHTASVRSLAFDAKGKTLASAGADRRIKLWDVSTGGLVREFEGHRGTVRALAFAPETKSEPGRLASASEDGEVRLWIVSGVRNSTHLALAGHTDMVISLAFSPGGKTLASGGLDATVKLWDPATGRERASLRGHQDGVSSLAFAPDAKQFATAGFDGAVRLWEPSVPVLSAASCVTTGCKPGGLAVTPDGRFVLSTGSGGLTRWDATTSATAGWDTPDTTGIRATGTCLAVSPDGSTSLEGTLTGAIRLIELKTGKILGELKGHQGEVTYVAHSRDGRQALSAGKDGRVSLWDLSTRRLIRTVNPDEGPIVFAGFVSGKGSDFVTAGARGVTVWNGDGTRAGRFGQVGQGVNSVAISSDGRNLATAGPDGVIRLWSIPSRTLSRAWKSAASRGLAFSPDGKVLATGHEDGEVVLWDSREGRQLGSLRGHRGAITTLAFTPGGRSVLSTGADGTIKRWDLAASRVTAKAVLKGDITCPWDLSFSHDGQTLAVADGSSDVPGAVLLWNTGSRTLRKALTGHVRGVTATAISPDGHTIASGGFDKTLRVWEAATGRERFVIDGLDGVVTELEFSPDGAVIATAGENGQITLWDAQTGDERSRLSGLLGYVQTVAFSPDGTKLAAGTGLNNRGEVRVFEVETGRVLDGFQGFNRPVLSVAFSPDGHTLAAGGQDDTIRLWDTLSGESRLTIAGLPGCVLSLAFSIDGHSLASAGRADGLVVIHDAKSGAEVARLVGHTNQVKALTFSPDGATLATVGADRCVRLWDVSSSEAKVNSNR